MKRFLAPQVVFALLAALVTLPACGLSYAVKSPPGELEQAFQEDIDSLTALYSRLTVPQHLVSPSPVLRGSELDVMVIFETLDRLHQVDGYLLAYYYHHDGMGGFPVLYTRKADEEPYLSGDAFALAHPECIKQGSNHNECSFIDYVLTDGTSLGYLQLLLFAMSGNQFYLDWHACYNDKRPVATKEAVNLLIDSLEDSGFWLPMNRSQVKKARSIDPSPRVEYESNTITIRVVWFTRWGGFYESKFSLKAAPPYTLEEIERTQLVEYDCGIRF